MFACLEYSVCSKSSSATSITAPRKLIMFLRQTISETKQIGWQQFNEQFADTPKNGNVSRRARILFILVFIAHAIGFGIVWVVGRELDTSSCPV